MKITAVKYLLMAQDMERAVTFYRDVMGLQEMFRSDDWSELSFGNAIVALHGGGDGSPNATGLSIQVDDINVAFQEVINAGGISLSEPVARTGEPIILAEFRDPEGNELMLTEYVG
jgi:predicted enzyme related to lactoylglutathione lyase